MCQHPESTLGTWVLTYPSLLCWVIVWSREHSLLCRSVCPYNPHSYDDARDGTVSHNLWHYLNHQTHTSSDVQVSCVHPILFSGPLRPSLHRTPHTGINHLPKSEFRAGIDKPDQYHVLHHTGDNLVTYDSFRITHFDSSTCTSMVVSSGSSQVGSLPSIFPNSLHQFPLKKKNPFVTVRGLDKLD